MTDRPNLFVVCGRNKNAAELLNIFSKTMTGLIFVLLD
jgi:hypothetical protein